MEGGRRSSNVRDEKEGTWDKIEEINNNNNNNNRNNDNQ